MKKNTQVIIAGGGPAGIATALSLTQRGIECAVVDDRTSVSIKAGETIPPNAKPVLVRSGIDHLLAAPEHLPCYGNRFLWGDENISDHDFFSNVHGNGWHVNRLFFEEQLQQYAASQGVRRIKGQVVKCNRSADGWQLTFHDSNKNVRELSCSFVADATGRACRIARLLGHKRNRLDSLTGLWSTFDLEEEVHPQYTFIQAVQDGWWYAAPLSGKKLALAFMTDADLLDLRMQQMPYFLKTAKECSLVEPLIQKIIDPPAAHPFVRTASTSFIAQRYTSSYLAVGDAAYAYDPLSSYGMVSALEGGYYAGHAIADALSGNNDALTAYDVIISQAFNIYLQMRTKQYQSEKRWSDKAFWSRRK
ncbi:MAG: tryptophan 7-halogenase [Chitinophagaceae bacterium]